ncbi:MAG: MotE family protein [Bacillus sp. (in: firmicutes)]
MAKEKETVNELNQEGKSYSKFQWFLFAIVIPIFFAIFILLVVLTFAGKNVFDWTAKMGSKIPAISDLMADEKETADQDIQKVVVNLEGSLKNQEAQIAKLESIIENKDKEIPKADVEKQRLKEQIKELEAVQGDDKRAFKDIIRTYESMSAKKAAPILTALQDEEAVKILSNIKAETLAEILEQMDPADAARLTKRLTMESGTAKEAQ